MSHVRIHNFSISLDGFATGEGQARYAVRPRRAAAPVAARHRFARREVLGGVGRPEGFDHAMAERHGPGIGAEIMGAGKLGPAGWQDDPEWRGGGATTRRSHADVRPDPQSAPVAGDGGVVRRSTSSTPRQRMRSRWRETQPPVRTSASAGARPCARVHRRRPRRSSARRAGADPARPRCSAVGRPGGVGAAVRRGGSLDAQRRHPPHVHPMT